MSVRLAVATLAAVGAMLSGVPGRAGPAGPRSDATRVAESARGAETLGRVLSLLAVARERTPFRFGGTRPRVRWGETPPPPPPPKPAVERPRLLLTGIVWGREPVALLEGIPGTDQAASLGAGVELHGFRVTRIEPTRVTVVGQDTVWTLEVRNPWP